MNTITVTLAASLYFGLAQQTESDWMVEVGTESGRLLVDPAGGGIRELPAAAPAGTVLSPDGRWRAYVEPVPGHHPQQDLWVSAADGTGARRLTSGARKAREVAWLPDSRHVVYVRGLGDHTQVYWTDVNAEKRVERRISQGRREQSWLPRVAPDGRIAYLVLRERNGKQMLCDLVIYHEGDRAAVARRLDITDHAWSPGGDAIAYSTSGTLYIHRFGTGETRTI